MICVDVRSGTWLSIPLKFVYFPHPVQLELMEGCQSQGGLVCSRRNCC